MRIHWGILRTAKHLVLLIRGLEVQLDAPILLRLQKCTTRRFSHVPRAAPSGTLKQRELASRASIVVSLATAAALREQLFPFHISVFSVARLVTERRGATRKSSRHASSTDVYAYAHGEMCLTILSRINLLPPIFNPAKPTRIIPLKLLQWRRMNSEKYNYQDEQRTYFSRAREARRFLHHPPSRRETSCEGCFTAGRCLMKESQPHGGKHYALEREPKESFVPASQPKREVSVSKQEHNTQTQRKHGAACIKMAYIQGEL